MYGADPGALDKNGRTASDYARQSGHTTLATRVANAQYEVSDRLSFFLCQRRPDHSNAATPEAHFIVPEVEHHSATATTGEERKVRFGVSVTVNCVQFSKH